jgi:uncharacterized membrane protein (DUF373 family)
MPDEPPAQRPSPTAHSGRTDGRLIRLLPYVEHAILWAVCVVLLAIAVVIMVQPGTTIVRNYGSGPKIIIVSIEELLLVLIVLEIFVTVLTHVRGGHLLLEPFVIVGVIAVIRHILSVVVGLTLVQSPQAEREGLIGVRRRRVPPHGHAGPLAMVAEVAQRDAGRRAMTTRLGDVVARRPGKR